jgi:anti-sigma B factor antagonist
MALDMKVREKKESTVIQLIGRVIGVDGEKFSKKLDGVYSKRKKRLILDMSNVTFLDSHGLGTIVYYFHSMQKEKRDFVILNTNPDPTTYVKRLFELTNLDKILTIVSTVDEAQKKTFGAPLNKGGG